MSHRLLTVLLLAMLATRGGAADAPPRLRVVVETDAGGDPDDEQSLVRFLLYVSEWDVEGIIANRPAARDGENLNPVRDGLGIVRRHLDAYGQVRPRLALHDPRYPTRDALWNVTVAGYDDVADGVDLLTKAIDRDDPRPLWFMNWGTDRGSAESCLKRALDKGLKERGPDGYARFKRRIRLSSDDKFGDHTWAIGPAFEFWAYTSLPDMDGGRWYRQFSPITKTAGGFDVRRDVLTGHGPLGALYPTNTSPPQKEGDSLMFLRLIPNGLNEPEHPEWGSWAGRFGPHERAAGRRYFAPNVRDTIGGKAHRDHTLDRWAEHLQNDFRARLDWCVRDYAHANHPPIVKLAGPAKVTARPGESVELDAGPSTDPDGNRLTFRWVAYAEATGYAGPAPVIADPSVARARVTVPAGAAAGQSLHLIAVVTDDGAPPLTRYARVLVDVK